ncbi:MAG: hypothetical protein R3B72_49555 [Polyangiaceae bacterium]
MPEREHRASTQQVARALSRRRAARDLQRAIRGAQAALRSGKTSARSQKALRAFLSTSSDTLARLTREVALGDRVLEWLKPQPAAPPTLFDDTLDRRVPVLLLPLRMLTRYASDASELRIRFMPDTASIDRHDELLSEAELTQALELMERWSDRSQAVNRSAFELLVTSFGALRAAWASQVALRVTEGAAASAAVHEGRTAPPRLAGLPRRIEVRGYVGSMQKFSGFTGPIDLELALFNPLEEGSVGDLSNLTSYDMFVDRVPASLRWMIDFASAEAVGMGLRVPLDEATGTYFDRVVALGVCDTANATDQGRALEELLTGHRYSAGLELMQIGASTNNDGTDPSALADPTSKELFAELAAAVAGPPAAADGEATAEDEAWQQTHPTDGERLARALGISVASLAHVKGAERYHLSTSQELDRVIFPVTLGYYLTQLVSGNVPTAGIEFAREHLARYVFARGPLPPVRVGATPYGVLPISFTAGWKAQSVAEDALTQIVDKLRRDWLEMAESAPRMGVGADPSAALYEILSMQAVSNVVIETPAMGGDAVSMGVELFGGPTSGTASHRGVAQTTLTAARQARALAVDAALERLSPLTTNVALKDLVHFPRGQVRIDDDDIAIAGRDPTAIVRYFSEAPVQDLLFDGGALTSEDRSTLLYSLIRRQMRLYFTELVRRLGPAFQEWFLISPFEEPFGGVPGIPPLDPWILVLRDLAYFDAAGILQTGSIFDLPVVPGTNPGMPGLTLPPGVTLSQLGGITLTAPGTAVDPGDAGLGDTGLGGGRLDFGTAAFDQRLQDLGLTYRDRFSSLESLADSIRVGDALFGRDDVALGVGGAILDDGVSFGGGTLEIGDGGAGLEIGHDGGVGHGGLGEGGSSADHDHPTIRAHGHIPPPGPPPTGDPSELDFPFGTAPGTPVAAPFGPTEPRTIRDVFSDEYRNHLERLLRVMEKGNGKDPIDSEAMSWLIRESLDLASHRVDAWITSLATRRLDEMRNARPDGVYLGVYGWVERLGPASEDGPASSGFFVAPSPDQTRATAILKSAHWERERATDEPDMAIDLGARRVQEGQRLLEGTRQGYSLGRILGHRCERLLNGTEAARHIPALRRAFPADPSVEIDADGIPAGTTDGLALLHAWRAWSETGETLPELAAVWADIDGSMEVLWGMADAAADQGLYESTLAAVRGAFQLSATFTDAAAGKRVAPPMEGLNTPQGGTRIFSHTVLSLDGVGPSAWSATSPLTEAFPHLDAWVGALLGPPTAIKVRCRYHDGVLRQRWVTMAEFGVSPLELMLMTGGGRGAGGELAIRLQSALRRSDPERRDIQLDLDARPDDGAPLAEVLPLLDQLRRVLHRTRPLRGSMLLDPDPTRDGGFGVEGSGTHLDVGDLASRTHAALEDCWIVHANLRARRGAAAVDVALGPPPLLDDATLRDALSSMRLSRATQLHADPSSADDAGWLAIERDVESRLAKAGLRWTDPSSAAEGAPAPGSDSFSTGDEESDPGWLAPAHLDGALGRLAAIVASPSSLTPKGRDDLARFASRALRAIFDVELPVVARVAWPATTSSAASHAGLSVPSDELEAWLFQQSKVRPELRGLELLRLSLDSPLPLSTAQCPYLSGDPWLGGGGLIEPPADAQCLVFVGDVSPSAGVLGVVVHSFDELIPERAHTAGIGVHFNQPSTEPPHVWLLAVPPTFPQPGETWDPDTLFDILSEAPDLARIRMVDPDLDTQYRDVLPAIYMSNVLTGENAVPPPRLDSSIRARAAPGSLRRKARSR